jgi:Ca-activated chloride channel family protein
VSFAHPAWLIALVLIPIAVLLYAAEEDRRHAQVAAFTSRPTAPSVLRSTPGWRRHAPLVFYALALALLVAALAKPQATIAVAAEQASVVLVTDRSGSMQATDVAPDRLRAAKASAEELLARVPRRLRVGAIMFNQRAEVLEPPTTDRVAVHDAVNKITPAGGTATGDALDAALRIVRPGGRGTAPAAIVLLSDGASVKGVNPLDAARRARRLKVPVHTISLGTAQGTIVVQRADGSGRHVVKVPPDPRTMRRIAQITGGETFAATDAAKLESAFKRLGSQVGRKHEKREITAGFAGGALVLVLLGAGLALRWSGRFA